MQTSTPIIDLHIHSALKPFGHSFYPIANTARHTDPACIWFNDRRSRIDNKIEEVLGICRYRQSDFTALTDGQVKVAFVSLYPIERDFFNIREGNKLKRFEVLLAEFTSMMGKTRINNIRDDSFSYFADLCGEYAFLRSLHGKETNARAYKLINSADELNLTANLLVILSIEGCHAFCDGNNPQDPSAWQRVADNIALVKAWPSPPLFVTFAHHFYNGLCTHARSLFEKSGKLLNQEYGMRDDGHSGNDGLPPISSIGKQVINLLLNTSNGRRILIDVKHMSLEARTEYYRMLKHDYADENIPVIWSHGALNLGSDRNDINMRLDIDVSVIYRTDGLIGIEIDQRILGYNKNRFWKKIKGIIGARKKAYDDAGYFWHQIITIAEYAHSLGHSDPWKCIALGSDYDGIINPLNSYPDATSLSALYQYLIVYLTEYWDNPRAKIQKVSPGPDAADIIYRVMYKNAYEFINRHYVR